MTAVPEIGADLGPSRGFVGRDAAAFTGAHAHATGDEILRGAESGDARTDHEGERSRHELGCDGEAVAGHALPPSASNLSISRESFMPLDPLV